MNKKHKKGFTLVELIIVVTILAILATISFISFQGYTKNTRDSNRLGTLKNIETGLQTYQAKSSKLPLPSNYLTITSSGETIGYQGYFGDEATRIIQMNEIPLDPLDKSMYTYLVNYDQKNYQLLTFLETGGNLAFNGIELLNKTYAAGVDYTNRYPKVLGQELGILLGGLNTPLQELKSASFTGVDIKTYNGTLGDIKAILSSTKQLEGTGVVLYNLTPNYKQKIQIVSAGNCSPGFTKIGELLSSNQKIEISCLGDKCNICEGNINKIQILRNLIVPSSCPTNFTEKGQILTNSGSVNVGCLPFGYCKICENNSFTKIETGNKIVTTMCPFGYKDVGYVITNGGSVIKCLGKNCRICEKE